MGRWGGKKYFLNFHNFSPPPAVLTLKAGPLAGRQVQPLEPDYDKLLALAAQAGFRLLESGAEIYRVEESIHRILLAYGAPSAEVFAIPNCIIVSLTAPGGQPLTQIRRMPPHSTDLDQLERYNDLCRRLCRDTPPPEQALSMLEEIHRTRHIYPPWVQILGSLLGGGMFTLFFGGMWMDALCGGLCGVAIWLCLFFTGRLGANVFFKTVAGGAVSALLALALDRLGLSRNVDLVIIGALMALVPGVAITNAMRDIMAGDMVAGISKGAEALLIGAAIALGTALALGAVSLLGGG